MNPRTLCPLGVTKKADFLNNLGNHHPDERFSTFFASIPDDVDFEVFVFLDEAVESDPPVELEVEDGESLIVEVGSDGAESDPPNVFGGGKDERVAEEAAMSLFMEVTEREMELEMMGFPDYSIPPSPSEFGDSFSEDSSLPDSLADSLDSSEGPWDRWYDRFPKEWTKWCQI